jgi:hypothetical protein
LLLVIEYVLILKGKTLKVSLCMGFSYYEFGMRLGCAWLPIARYNTSKAFKQLTVDSEVVKTGI